MTADAQRDKVLGRVRAALIARNDVMRGEIVRRAAFAARSVALNHESRELPPFGLLALRRRAGNFLG